MEEKLLGRVTGCYATISPCEEFPPRLVLTFASEVRDQLSARELMAINSQASQYDNKQQ